ncbi:M48 family metallopeptidase [Candidatus Micrarchaeota archaeon]|nr:M48 family metallopeptidase [Candidatus Micrarchaeota archaeon]
MINFFTHSGFLNVLYVFLCIHMFGFYKEQEQLVANLGDEAIVFTLHRRPKTRRVSLHVNWEGLRVTAPRFASARKVVAIVQEKRNWVDKWMRFYAAVSKPPVLQHGSTISYLGEQCVVLFARSNREKVELNKGILTLFLKNEANAAKVLEKWFRKKAGELVTQRVGLLSNILGLQVNCVRIKRHRSRWGSCSSGKNLNFNWRIVSAPLDVVDYLVIHELVHLRHFNHGREFWQEVRRFCPAYEEREKWLGKNGPGLGF